MDIAASRTLKAAARLCFAAALLSGLIGAPVSAPVQAKDWKTVRIGTDATSEPFESVDSKGNIVGWEIDYGRALCAAMKVICTFQNQDWDGIIPALLSGMSITPARQAKVLFSDPYYESRPVFIGQAAERSDDVSPAALKGKAIGTQSSTIFANYLATYYKNSDIKLYPGGDEPTMDLADGRLDYAMTDNVAAEHFLETSAHGCCRVIATLKRDPAIFGTGVGAAFRKQDTELCRMFNQAIAGLYADGTYQRLAKRYFKVDIRPGGGS
jgi:polar amino acid transport system substrate-binding protein